MADVIYFLAICIAVPLSLMLPLLEKKSRITVGFMIIGIFMCLYCAELNGFLNELIGRSSFYFTTTITPIVEEICKALPILYFAFLFSDKRENLINIALAVGIGFAILENAYVFVANLNEVSLLWAISRALGAGLMHGVCTALVGIGLSFVHKKKKLFYTGSFALLTASIIYHASFNVLIQSPFKYASLLFTVLTYVVIGIFVFSRKERKIHAKKLVEKTD